MVVKQIPRNADSEDTGLEAVIVEKFPGHADSEDNGLEAVVIDQIPGHADSEDTGLEAVVVEETPVHAYSEDTGLEAVVVEKIPSQGSDLEHAHIKHIDPKHADGINNYQKGHEDWEMIFKGTEFYRNSQLELQLLLMSVGTAVVKTSSIIWRLSDKYTRNIFWQVHKRGLKQTVCVRFN